MLKGRIAIERFAICLIGLSVALTQVMPACAMEPSGDAAPARTKECRSGAFPASDRREQEEANVRVSYNKKELKKIEKDSLKLYFLVCCWTRKENQSSPGGIGG